MWSYRPLDGISVAPIWYPGSSTWRKCYAWLTQVGNCLLLLFVRSIPKGSFLRDCQSSQPALDCSPYPSPYSPSADFALALRCNSNTSSTEPTAASTNLQVDAVQNNTTQEHIYSHSALSNDIYRPKRFGPNNASPARTIYSKRYPQAIIVYCKLYSHTNIIYYEGYSQVRVAYRGRYFGAGMVFRFICWVKKNIAGVNVFDELGLDWEMTWTENHLSGVSANYLPNQQLMCNCFGVYVLGIWSLSYIATSYGCGRLRRWPRWMLGRNSRIEIWDGFLGIDIWSTHF